MESLNYDMEGYKKDMKLYKNYMAAREFEMEFCENKSEDPFPRPPRESNYIYCDPNYLRYDRTIYGKRFQVFVSRDIDDVI